MSTIKIGQGFVRRMRQAGLECEINEPYSDEPDYVAGESVEISILNYGVVVEVSYDADGNVSIEAD